MSEGNYIYVCSKCGSIVTITAAPIPDDEDWACDNCGHVTTARGGAEWPMREFTDDAEALKYASRRQEIMG